MTNNSVESSSDVRPDFEFRGDPALGRLVAGGRPIVLVGRFSGESGLATYRAAVHDLLGAAEALERRLGVPVKDALPSEEELIAALRSSKRVKSAERSGKAFSNRFFELPLPDIGVHVLLSAGTGKKLDESLLQPYVTRLTQVAASVDASLVFGKRWDRISRRAWSLGPLMTWLEGADGFLGDDRYGVRKVGGLGDIEVFLSASMSEEEAAKLPAQTRLGMLRRTGTEMVDGRVAFHVTCTAPPGFARLRLMSDVGGVGASFLVLDDPEWWPSRKEVAAGLPEIVDGDGVPVSQVENVRWLLKRLGRPEWTSNLLAEGLAQRRFSTDGLRKMRGAGAHWGDGPLPKGPYLVLASVIRNLDLYETGIFRLALGVEGVEGVEISGCLPPGGWASGEDFARIRAWRLREAKRVARRHASSLGGVTCTVDGSPARLLTSRSQRKGQPPGYLVVKYSVPDGSDLQRRGVYVSHAELVESIVQGLERLDFEPLRLWRSEVDVDEDLDVTSQLRTAEAALASLNEQRERWLSDVLGGGRGQFSGALLRDMSDRYTELVESRIPEAELEVRRLTALLEQRRADRARTSEGAEAEDLLELVGSLRDPKVNVYSRVWREALRNVAFSVERSSISGHGLVKVSWSGELLIRGAGKQFVVPFASSRAEGIATQLDHRVTVMLEEMRRGVPLYRVDVERKVDVYREMVCRLGLDTKVFVTGKCDDPRILRVAMAMHCAPERSVDDIAAEFGESEHLVRRVQEVHRDPDRKWFVWAKPNGQGVGGLLAQASEQGGSLKSGDEVGHFKTWQAAITGVRTRVMDEDLLQQPPKRGLVVRPCRWCGSHKRGSMRIPEPTGLMCLDCWRDSAGVQWYPELGPWLDNAAAWGIKPAQKRIHTSPAPKKGE